MDVISHFSPTPLTAVKANTSIRSHAGLGTKLSCQFGSTEAMQAMENGGLLFF